MRAFSRCLSRKAFFVRTAIARIPRDGSDALTAVTIPPVGNARRRPTASCREKSRSSSSAPGHGGRRRSVRHRRRSVVRDPSGHDDGDAAATGSGPTSAVVREPRHLRRHEKSPLLPLSNSPAVDGGGAEDGDGEVRLRRFHGRWKGPRRSRRRLPLARAAAAVERDGASGDDAAATMAAVSHLSNRPRPKPFARARLRRAEGHPAVSS